MIPAIFGLAGPVLEERERALFREAEPAGFILFRRNCVDRGQLRGLTDALRDLAGRDVPVLIDQEGGRVARLATPEWPGFPPAARFGALYEVAPLSAIEAARLNARAIAAVLGEVGVNVDCLPLLDVPAADGHDIIGDRAFGDEPMRVAALGRAVIEGLRAGGVAEVVKHMPGQGRARADSHVELPVVDAGGAELERDLEPFVRLAGIARAGMTAHVVYTVWDGERCASLSPAVIERVIRGRIGFDGLLMSDDLGMHALEGGMGERAAGVVEAGCDLALHCSGDFAEMEAVTGALGVIGERARARLERWMEGLGREEVEFPKLIAERDALLAAV